MVSFMTVYTVIITVTSISMLGAPLTTAIKMEQQKTVGIMSPLYFCSQFSNCILWGVCGVFLNDMGILICNEVGTAISTYCLLVYLSVARQEEKSGHKLATTTYRESWTIIVISLCFSLVVSVFLTVYYGINQKLTLTVGEFLASMGTLTMLASPLTMITTIIKEKNADGLAPVTLTCATINTSLWAIYGIMTSNPFIFGTQFIGLISCVIQLVLLVRYGSKPNDVKEVKSAIAPVPFID